MLPYVASTSFSLGPVTLQTWGSLVAAGFLVGLLLAARRAKTKGLDPLVIWDMAIWIILAAMVGARLFHVLAYDPAYYLAHPWHALDPRAPGYAIYGGIVGAVAAFWAFARRRGLDLVAYADVLAWGMPWGCGVGRIGCFLIHDHPGTLSSSLLAVRYPDGRSRHDLGLYLSMVGFAIGVTFLLLDRRARGRGFYVGAFLALDAASRLWLDIYRTADQRLLGLTPTQWAAIPVLVLGAYLVLRSRATLRAYA